MKKKILLRSLIGAPIGVTVSLIITIIFSACVGQGIYYPAPPDLIDWCGNTVTAVIVQMLCSMFIGAVCSGSSVIWELEKWSLLKQTLVHCAIISVPFFGVGYVLSWMPHHLYGVLGYVGGFVLIYIIMWCSIYFSIKAKIAKLNKQLIEIQREDSKENGASK